MGLNGYHSIKTPAPWVKIYNIVRLFLGHQSYTITGEELQILINTWPLSN